MVAFDVNSELMFDGDKRAKVDDSAKWVKKTT